MRAVMIVVVVAGLVALTLAAGGPGGAGGQLATPADTRAFTDKFLTSLNQPNSRPFDAYQMVRAAINDPQVDVDAMRATAEQTLTNARNAYGKPIGHELISTKNLGTSFIRYDYLFRLEKSALHFQITFYRGSARFVPVDLFFEEELEELFFNLGR